MAEPCSFDGETNVLDKPSNMTREDCEPLCIRRMYLKEQGLICVMSCWKLTQEELNEINKTGRVWLIVVGVTMPPVIVSGIKLEGEALE